MSFGKAYVAPKMFLNEQLKLSDLPPEHSSAFYGKVRNVRLNPGFQLYKFTSYDMKNPAGVITPWWSPVPPYEIDPGLQSRLDLANRLHVHASDLSRSFAAVSEDWNKLESILVVRLEKFVHGLWGPVAAQPRQQADFRKGKETPKEQQGAGIQLGDGRVLHIRTHNLPGKAWQFYIPNLTDDHVVQVSKTAVAAPQTRVVIPPTRPLKV
jgi:hypothetical protein